MPTYALARFSMLRLLGLIYCCAFAVFINQGPALIGERGLLPASAHLQGATFFEAPTVFRIAAGDGALLAVGWVGLLLALAVMLGCTNAAVMATLWVLYLSVDHVGQLFWSFGWENQLLETGFLAIFLCPLRSVTPFPLRAAPLTTLVLFRWLAFRIHLGAGLIKLRGDDCWLQLTCLQTHFETQPVPSPLTPFFHHLPASALTAGVVLNHVCELLVPFAFFGPRAARNACGLIAIGFQLLIAVSGNLSFLNWLTIVPVLACLDDGLLQRLVPSRLAAALALAQQQPPARGHRWAAGLYSAVVAVLSLQVVFNLASPRQAMNRSYDPFSWVNTYGAFGSVGRERLELAIEGSDDGGRTWRAYEFKCKPTDVDRRPCFMSPYHHRLDWQVWFAAMSEPDDEPWLVHLVWKLLHQESGALALLEANPFPLAPPREIRVRRFRYRLNRYSEPGWWSREERDLWLAPVALDSPRLRLFLAQHGWLTLQAAEEAGLLEQVDAPSETRDGGR